MNKQDVMAIESLKSLLNVVESIRQAGAETMQALIAMRQPYSVEGMNIAMLVQAAMSFSVALSQWIETVEERQEELKQESKTQGN